MVRFAKFRLVASEIRTWQDKRQAAINKRRINKALSTLNSSNDDNDNSIFEEQRKNRRILRYLKPSKVQRPLKIILVGLGGLVFFGVAIGIYVKYFSDSSTIRIPLLSKLLNFFKSSFSDQDSNVNDALEKTKTSNIGKWCYVSAIFIVFGLAVVKFLNNKETAVEIEIQPESIKINRKELRIITGGILVVVGQVTMFYSPSIGLGLYLTGWQMATHP